MDTNNIQTKTIKIGFLGSSMAGKTSIINRFMGLEFCQETISTIGMEKCETKFRVKNNEDIKLYGIHQAKKDFLEQLLKV